MCCQEKQYINICALSIIKAPEWCHEWWGMNGDIFAIQYHFEFLVSFTWTRFCHIAHRLVSVFEKYNMIEPYNAMCNFINNKLECRDIRITFSISRITSWILVQLLWCYYFLLFSAIKEVYLRIVKILSKMPVLFPSVI